MASSTMTNVPVAGGPVTLFDSTRGGPDSPAQAIAILNCPNQSDNLTPSVTTIQINDSAVHAADARPALAPGQSVTLGRGNPQGRRKIVAWAVGGGSANVNLMPIQAVL